MCVWVATCWADGAVGELLRGAAREERTRHVAGRRSGRRGRLLHRLDAAAEADAAAADAAAAAAAADGAARARGAADAAGAVVDAVMAAAVRQERVGSAQNATRLHGQ